MGVDKDAKKIIFTACHSGKLKLTFTSPKYVMISTSPQNVLMSRVISQFFCNLNSSTNFITEFTSPIAKPTSPGLSDSTFFGRWDGYCHKWAVYTEWIRMRKFGQWPDPKGFPLKRISSKESTPVAGPNYAIKMSARGTWRPWAFWQQWMGNIGLRTFSLEAGSAALSLSKFQKIRCRGWDKKTNEGEGPKSGK